MSSPADSVRDLTAVLGAAGVVQDPADAHRYERGYRYGSGQALAIVRPATVPELRSVVRYCFTHELKMIPQGANTGLVGASTPDHTGEQVVVSLDRLRGVEAVDVHNRTAVVLGGTRLSALNREVGQHELFFPIDLGSDPILGGMVATNTGGSRLLRYGDVQRNLLGLEVVLPDAEATVLTDLTGLRDGGDHFNLVWPHEAGTYDAAVVEIVRQLIYDRVVRKFGGSFSAEHGVGPHNIAYCKCYTSAADRTIAARLTGIFDPKGLLGTVDFA
jgi:FAD/FMN-containing dehydrogenase